jgi:hypothetical protein
MKKALIAAVVVVILAMAGIMVYLLLNNRNLEQEKMEMLELAELDKQEMENDYERLTLQYTEMMNSINNDSIIAQLTQEQMRTQQLLEEQIDRGLPVLYWCCIDLKPSFEGPAWTLPDGTQFLWTSNEHCMLLVGYDTDRDTLIFNDPWDGHGVVDYDRKLVLQRHREQKERAVILISF